MHMYVFLMYFDAFLGTLGWGTLGGTSFSLKYDACQRFQASWNSWREPREKREKRENRKWCQERWLGPHLPHAPGARMTAVTQTPSNEHSVTGPIIHTRENTNIIQ